MIHMYGIVYIDFLRLLFFPLSFAFFLYYLIQLAIS